MRDYYRDVFIPGIRDGTVNEPVARFVGDDFQVDQSIMVVRHDREIPFLLTELAPTGILLAVPFAVLAQLGVFGDGPVPAFLRDATLRLT